MKITFAQINTVPANFEINYTQILEAINKAKADKSDILIYPELTICGYVVKELILNPGLLKKNRKN